MPPYRKLFISGPDVSSLSFPLFANHIHLIHTLISYAIEFIGIVFYCLSLFRISYQCCTISSKFVLSYAVNNGIERELKRNTEKDSKKQTNQHRKETEKSIWKHVLFCRLRQALFVWGVKFEVFAAVNIEITCFWVE